MQRWGLKEGETFGKGSEYCIDENNHENVNWALTFDQEPKEGGSQPFTSFVCAIGMKSQKQRLWGKAIHGNFRQYEIQESSVDRRRKKGYPTRNIVKYINYM